jgi:hypothetical protein
MMDIEKDTGRVIRSDHNLGVSEFLGSRYAYALYGSCSVTYLLSISSGALLVLAACNPTSVAMPSIQKAIIFESPLLFNIPPACSTDIDLG